MGQYLGDPPEGAGVSEIEYQSRMGPSDALMWAIEKDPGLRSTITSVATFDRPLDRERLLVTMERATRVVPRLRQRVRSNPLSVAPPRWETDPNYDLAYHVRFGHLGGSADLRDLLDAARPIAMQGFDRARPLWEMVVLDGLEGGRSGVVLKVHHAITDGVGAVQMMLEMFDFTAEGTEREMPDAPEPVVMGQTARFLDAAAHQTRRQLGMARSMIGNSLLAIADPVGSATRATAITSSATRLLAPSSDCLSPIMTGRSLSVYFDTLTLPLAAMKAAASKGDAKLNAAFVAGVAGGFRRYHEAMDAPVGQLRMAMPINVRTAESETTAGNQFVPARMVVDVSETDPEAMIRQVAGQVDGVRSEPGLRLTDTLSDVLTRLPTTTTTALFGSMLRGVDFTTSNVPGAPMPVYLAGAELEGQFALGPMSGAGANITLLSYCDDVNVGINLDPAAVTDPELMVASIRDSFDEVVALAD